MSFLNAYRTLLNLYPFPSWQNSEHHLFGSSPGTLLQEI